MRDDRAQYELRQYYKKLKVLKQELAEADTLPDLLRAGRQLTIRSEIEQVEAQIDRTMRRI